MKGGKQQQHATTVTRLPKFQGIAKNCISIDRSEQRLFLTLAIGVTAEWLWPSLCQKALGSLNAVLRNPNTVRQMYRGLKGKCGFGLRSTDKFR